MVHVPAELVVVHDAKTTPKADSLGDVALELASAITELEINRRWDHDHIGSGAVAVGYECDPAPSDKTIQALR